MSIGGNAETLEWHNSVDGEEMKLDWTGPTTGFILPRTEGFLVEEIKFFGFGKGMNMFRTCSECEHYKLETGNGV